MQSCHKIVVLMFALLTSMFITVYAATPEELVRMGVNYYKGNGVPVDKAKAVECWKEAAEQGNATAQFALANCYQRGDGIDEDLKEAVKWFQKAADQGYEPAIKKLKTLNVDDNSETNNPSQENNNLVLPDDPSKIQIQEYSIGNIDKVSVDKVCVKKYSAPTTLVKIGTKQLPPIPKELSSLHDTNLAITQIIKELNEGTHPSVKNKVCILTKAKTQYETIKARRDKQWNVLDSLTREQLAEKIASNPDAASASFLSLRPDNVKHSDYLRLVVWGKKAEQAKIALENVKKEYTDTVSTEINNLRKNLESNASEVKQLLIAFQYKVFDSLLEQCKGYNDISVVEIPDEINEFLSDSIPALSKYNLWSEDELWDDVVIFWKFRRPCIVKKLVELQSRKAGERKVEIINGVEFAFRWCPPGTFIMGSPTIESGVDSDEKQHRVTLTKGFWMMETEVTQKQWQAIMDNNPSHFKGDDLPVEEVSQDDCLDFCKKCNEQYGIKMQLPTEAQWEYACRAGSTGAFAGILNDMAWYNEKDGTHPVATKKPNAWGLYDMHGNVYEWCLDRYEDYPSESVTDPVGPSSGVLYVTRGGCWYIYSKFCRSAHRFSTASIHKHYDLGFRCVINPVYPLSN